MTSAVEVLSRLASAITFPAMIFIFLSILLLTIFTAENTEFAEFFRFSPPHSLPAPLNVYHVKCLFCARSRLFHWENAYFTMAKLFIWGDLRGKPPYTYSPSKIAAERSGSMIS